MNLKTKIKMYTILNLPLFMCGCKTLLTLREEHGMSSRTRSLGKYLGL
jgi:hypothetical protein